MATVVFIFKLIFSLILLKILSVIIVNYLTHNLYLYNISYYVKIIAFVICRILENIEKEFPHNPMALR